MIGTIRFRAWGTVINYYEHHIGDYAAATAHLSLIEDAIYSRMLRRYYLQEVPLPADVSQVARLVGARGADEVEAVRVVLGEFFVLADDGWHNKRADQEIARYQEKCGKAAKSAAARWGDKKPPTAKPPHCERNANAMRTHSEGNAKAMLTNNQEPITKESKEPTTLVADSADADPAVIVPADESATRRKRTAIPCPVQVIADLWDECLPELRSPIVWNDSRRTAVATRWREMAVFNGWTDQAQGVEFFRKTFNAIRGSPFLMGKVQPRDRNQKPFALTLDWMFGPKNFVKVVEGKYHEAR